MAAQTMLLEFHRGLAERLRGGDQAPRTRREWEERRRGVLAAMRRAAGEWPAAPPLAPRVWGVVERPGLRIERLTFTSRPGVAVTANAYVPLGREGRLPAVLCV